jgi:hypothetical protein
LGSRKNLASQGDSQIQDIRFKKVKETVKEILLKLEKGKTTREKKIKKKKNKKKKKDKREEKIRKTKVKKG